MARPTLKEAQNIVLGAGYAMFEKDDANGTLEGGELYLGTTEQISFNVAAETVEVPDEDPPVEENLVDITNKIVRAGQLTCKNMSNEVMELFFMGVAETHTQAGGSVSDEDKDVVFSGRHIQLGAGTTNPGGVRAVSSVTVKSKEGDDASAWQASTAQVVGDYKVPTVANTHWYMATVAGTTAASEPTWPTDGSTVVDGGVTWQDMGLITYTVTTDYTVDADLGTVFVVPTGAIANAISLADAVSVKIGLTFAYTKAANTRQQVCSSGTKAVTGKLHIIADNSTGTNRDIIVPLVTLNPNGDWAMKSRTDAQTATFDLKIGRRDGYEQLYADGRPV